MATPIVSFGATTAGFPTSVNIASQDVGSGSNRVAVVAIGATNTSSDPVSVSIGSDSLTAQGTLYTDGAGWKFRVYAGVLTVTGSQTVTATWDDDANVKLVAGCVLPSSALPIGDLTTGAGTSSTLQPTWTIDSATGETVVALFFLDDARTFTASAPATALTGTGLGGSTYSHGMYEDGATSVVINGTLGGANVGWRGFGFSVPASGGGGGSSIAAISNYYRMMRSA